jgi:hypothetical protein
MTTHGATSIGKIKNSTGMTRTMIMIGIMAIGPAASGIAAKVERHSHLKARRRKLPGFFIRALGAGRMGWR